MKTLGIDYGSKRVGLAISDDGGSIAFPFKIIENKSINYLTEYILNIITELKIKKIVLGQSLDKNNNPNPIYFETLNLETQLKEKLQNLKLSDSKQSDSKADHNNIEILWQKEWYSSVEARNTPTQLTKSGNTKKINKIDSYIDDKAACIILQQFLDKQKQNNIK
jgi:putative Holliday junction resolvase